MADFLTNLDNLHDHLASTYPGTRAPSFGVKPGPSGQILLHYYNDRKGLHPVVLGIVKVAGKEIFNTEVSANISVVSEFGDRAHATMEVTEQNKEGKSCLLRSGSKASETLSKLREDLAIGRSGGQVECLLLDCDENFFGEDLTDNCHAMSVIADGRGMANTVFVVRTKEGVLKPRGSDNSQHDGGDGSSPAVLRLKGQMVSVEDAQSILLLCSPRVKDIGDMQRIGLFFSDLAIHDPARELFLRSHYQCGERELIEKQDEATDRVLMLQSKLDEDKKLTEELVHSILPSKVSVLLMTLSKNS
ncbi:guanylate cyclase soluble subunit beta-1 [Rhipicephalus sanguineus]|uniref:guanylate cyclase soluble subunit beta-1 n=1 Tax=Rhipicephalus sanguineus TaxID=34632 RepID=UPI00189578D7|nr:guanylate cyclase soluble subunit beta-1 [Rhipicephalus sanguineus]